MMLLPIASYKPPVTLPTFILANPHPSRDPAADTVTFIRLARLPAVFLSRSL